jgi:hypothetical protein
LRDKTSPARDLQVSEVGLPELVDGCGFILELIGCFHDDEGWASDEVMGFDKPVH